MKLKVDKNRLRQQPEFLMRRAGYGYMMHRQGGQDSFVRRLGNADYPRFHMYISEEDGEVIFNLHLDQKKPSYQGSHAHNAEYDGELVEAEIARLRQFLGV
jgi:hypothetical protein